MPWGEWEWLVCSRSPKYSASTITINLCCHIPLQLITSNRQAVDVYASSILCRKIGVSVLTNEPVWNDVRFFLDKQGVTERPEYYIVGHTVRFKDDQEGFGKMHCAERIPFAMQTGRGKVFSATYTQPWVWVQLISAKGSLMLLVFLLLDAQFYCSLSQQRLKDGGKVIGYWLRWSGSQDI